MEELIYGQAAPPVINHAIGTLRNHPIRMQPSARTIQKEDAGFWQTTFHDPVATFTALLCLATTGLWIFTGFLWRATVRLASDAKSSGADQADKMERSIAEAAKAARAMEALANSNAASGAQLVDSVNLSRRAMRATISVVIAKGYIRTKYCALKLAPRS